MYNPVEDSMRKLNYLKMIDQINKHNLEFDEGKWSYIQGLSQFSDMVSLNHSCGILRTS